MNKSQSIKELATALGKAQSEMPFAKMDSTNPFFKSKYADLGSVIATAKPVLARNNLSISQNIEGANGMVGVTTIIMHSSGEWLESSVFLPIKEGGKSLAQDAGSTITYLRRYTYAAILGMYADEDTDGEKANGHKPEHKEVAGVTLEEAIEFVDRNGVKYGDLPTEKLAIMVNAIRASKKDLTDEQLRKSTGLTLILNARNAGTLPEPAGLVETAEQLGGQQN